MWIVTREGWEMKIPRMSSRRWLAFGLFASSVTAFVTAAGPASGAAATGEIWPPGRAPAVSGSYIVVLKDDVVPSDADRIGISGKANHLASTYGGSVGRVYATALHGFEATLSEAAARRLAEDPAVAYVEQNHLVRVADTQVSPPSWGLDRVDQRSLPLDSTYTSPNAGSGVHAYIIDTGIRTTHADFAGRATSGFDAIDGGSADDCNGHGTHVAGTVGGVAYGVAKDVSLVAVRVLDCAGTGTATDLLEGLDWVTANAVKPAVASLSVSLAGVDTAVDSAIANSIASGVVYAAAAGNDNTDACTRSPGRAPAAITVGATTSNDARAPYSNYGSCVDLFAPGSDVTSAGYSDDTATAVLSGTSMAAAHVTGAAALALAANPSWTPNQVSAYLVGEATTGVVFDACNNSPNRLLDIVTGTATAQPAAANLVSFATPVAVLDTRFGTGGVTGARGPDSTTTFQVLGVGGIPTTGVSAVLIRVAAGSPTVPTFLELWPDGVDRPVNLSMLNVGAGENTSNVAVVAPGTNGRIAVYNRSGNTQILVDVQGYFKTATSPAAGGFVPVAHSRIIDTRTGIGTSAAPIQAGGSRTVTIAGSYVPAGATAAYLNLLVPGAATGGWLAAAPPGTLSGNGILNYVAGSTQSGASVKLSTDGRVTFYNKGSTAIDLVVTLEGYFTGVAEGGSKFRPVACRLFNTRTAGTGLPLAAGAFVDVQVAGVNGVPLTGVAGAVLNLTVTPESSGYLKAWPTGKNEPSVTMMDFNAGVWRTNAVVLRPGSGGKIHLYNGSSGTIHLIVDIQGWFQAPPSAGAVKIMPLGDSITWGQGSDGEAGYRGPLWLRLSNETGYAPNFVGSVAQGIVGDTPIDQNHEGHKGYTIADIQAGATGWVTTYQPDVVLLHIGTNDMFKGVSPSTALSRLSALIDQILLAQPNAQIIVAKIIQTTNIDVQPRIDQYNAGIPTVVQAKGAQVRLVDMTGTLLDADLYDTVHPNDAGYAKMSDRWYPVLTSVLGG
jgi:subtilisin family serine protease/lysophospholipase L1-like esterase